MPMTYEFNLTYALWMLLGLVVGLLIGRLTWGRAARRHKRVADSVANAAAAASARTQAEHAQRELAASHAAMRPLADEVDRLKRELAKAKRPFQEPLPGIAPLTPLTPMEPLPAMTPMEPPAATAPVTSPTAPRPLADTAPPAATSAVDARPTAAVAGAPHVAPTAAVADAGPVVVSDPATAVAGAGPVVVSDSPTAAVAGAGPVVVSDSATAITGARPVVISDPAAVAGTARPAGGDGRELAAEGSAPDIRHLKGVGDKFAAALTGLGLGSVDALARLNADEALDADTRLGVFNGRIAKDRLVEQAGLIDEGRMTEYEARFGKLGGPVLV